MAFKKFNNTHKSIFKQYFSNSKHLTYDSVRMRNSSNKTEVTIATVERSIKINV